jgi:putative flavoprotein involved in K+ transport
MNAVTITKHADHGLIQRWLLNFEFALRSGDASRIGELFCDECYWRDMLAFTWTIAPYEGNCEIAEGLLSSQDDVHARNFSLASGRTPPRVIRRLGSEVIEAIFAFETDFGLCNGVLRLPVDDPTRARVFSTSLTEIKGHPEPVGELRKSGNEYSRNFGGDNWEDLRRNEQAFEGREPEVLIVGASQFGVTMAARLKLLDVDTLVVDRLPRVGDSWRNRYHALALHNHIAKNHFPYIPFPASWPKYLSKNMLAGWIEMYAWAMECNVWTGTTFLNGEFDAAESRWNARVARADGSERVLRPKHIIFANGVLGGRKKMEIPGLDAFKGEALHTEDYKTGGKYKGKRVLVLGAGTSAHDCAQDLHCSGASVKLVQRGPATIVNIDSATTSDALYVKDQNTPIADLDLISMAATPTMIDQFYRMNTEAIREMDKDLLQGLAEKGFKLDFGPDGTGYQGRVRESHSGYYINCGASDLIASGDIGLLHWEDVDRIVADGLQMKSGEVEKADVIMAATGFYPQHEIVADLLGPEAARKIGKLWGLDVRRELSNMWVETAVPGIWFTGGGLSHNRVFSRYLALQIKARLLGITSHRSSVEKGSMRMASTIGAVI